MYYKYEKFEKLSDAVKAYESGETVYYERGKDWYFQKTGNTFSMRREYYRREEIKPRTFYTWEHKQTGYIKGITECDAFTMPQDWKRIKLVEVLDEQ